MENVNESTNVSGEGIQRIEVGIEGQSFLYETAKWAKLLSVIGYGIVLLLLLIASFSSSIISYLRSIYGGVDNISAQSISVFYVFLAVLYFIPSLYLFQFSINVKKGVRENSSLGLTNSFSRLKSFFKFWAILMLVVIIFYAVGITLLIVGGMHLMNEMVLET
jgi:hypothetical protein